MKKMTLRLVMLVMAALLACAPALAEVDGYFIYGCAELDGKYYLKMGLAENQSRQNLLTNGEGLAVYAATPAGGEEDELYAVSGARMRFTVVTDAEVLAALEIEEGGSTILCEITETKSLG